jgi:hypothetical protein
MRKLVLIIICAAKLTSCSDNNPSDPPIVGKWVLNRYEAGQNNNPPGQCDYAAIHHIQNTGQKSYINTSTNCGTLGIKNVGTWVLRNDSLICTDANGALLEPSGKIITLTTSELTTSIFESKYFYKKQN